MFKFSLKSEWKTHEFLPWKLVNTSMCLTSKEFFLTTGALVPFLSQVTILYLSLHVGFHNAYPFLFLCSCFYCLEYLLLSFCQNPTNNPKISVAVNDKNVFLIHLQVGWEVHWFQLSSVGQLCLVQPCLAGLAAYTALHIWAAATMPFHVCCFWGPRLKETAAIWWL